MPISLMNSMHTTLNADSFQTSIYSRMAAWRSDDGVGRINEVTLRRAYSYWDG